ncbi:MAG: acyl-CoA thioesterase [Lachnospiraceae bacterium]|nr:acyl-CoA thioesterase [Lachnospira sp.]MBQ8730962.1 acyl-CoA thioesterase [Lachnospiraceae bacterium]
MYERKVNYYETDAMAIVHHSNYIRWFEEARMDYMDKLGVPYKELEDIGIISPTTEVNCKYKSMVRFGDTILIDMSILEYNGIKLTIGYTITDKATGEIRSEGCSKHCFLDRSGKFVTLKKSSPKVHEAFENAKNM